LYNPIKKSRTLWAALFLALGVLLLAGCGVLPTTNWAGLATDGSTIFAAQIQLLAVDPSTANGALNWKFPDKTDQKNLIYGIPAVADGKIYVGNYNNDFYALDAKTGSQVWVYNKPDLDGKGRFLAGPVVAGGLILVPSTDHNLYAFTNDGKIAWRFKSGGSLWASVATDGKLVYLPGMDHYLYALDLQTGKKVWELNLGASMLHAPVLVEDGSTLYVTTLSQELTAVNTSTHQVAWKVKTDGSVWSAPLLYKGSLYFGTDQKKVYAVSANENGKILWQKDASGAVIASPALLGESLVFVTESGEVNGSGDIFTMSLDGNKLWTRNLKGKLYANPVVVGDRVVVSAEGGDSLLTWYDAQGKDAGSFVMPK
jgi:outer membrane protein assembly factor BamB